MLQIVNRLYILYLRNMSFVREAQAMYNIIDCSISRRVEACNFILLNGGSLHPDRVLVDIHDLLYVLEGNWEIIQDGVAYTLQKDDIIFLHAGHHHLGKTGCALNTLVMFIHVMKEKADGTALECTHGQEWDGTVLINSIIHCQGNPRIKGLFKDIINHFYSDKPNIKIKLSALLMDLFYELSACPSNENGNPVEDEIVNQVIYKIRTSPQKYYTIKQLASEVHVSSSTLTEHFKRATNSTVYQYQVNTKLNMAQPHLTSNSGISLKEIAKLYGFCDEFHFSKLFKKKYGVSPSNYKKMNEKELFYENSKG